MTGDRTITFTRGSDTVHVTFSGEAVARAKLRLWLAYGCAGLVCITFAPYLWPLAPIGVGLFLTLLGRLGSLEQHVRDQAERAASKEFERFESERSQALADLRRQG